MVRHNISRVSPNSCGCVLETETEYDDNGNIISEPKFLLMNNVCDAHKHLASTTHKTEHTKLSTHVLDLIEEAKTVNLKQVDDLIEKATRASVKRDLMACRLQVLNFNAKLDEEWAELTTQPHAYDSHIHDLVLKENREKNAQLNG